MKIDREQWTRLSALLDAALDIGVNEREAWVDQLSGDAGALIGPLRKLLAQRAHIETDDFLKTPDFASALRLESARAHSPQMDLQASSEIGAYRLLRELGRGGMGAVWLAERIDGKLKRQVALKFPYAGPNQRQLAERLVRERDILARLEHPNIARLYDADVTAQGQSYLVLEYVDGIPCNDYCDQHRLSIRRRLALFLQVLNAVQYAHTRLVIHRDLKPSNILTTGDGVVRLLDFGIAKLISDGEVKETALTQFGGHALTPDYASPEQIAAQPLTTASDIYSLGVVLYELLVGARPYRLKRDSRASLEAAIAEADVIVPSRAIIDAEAASKRSASVRQLTRELRGDLDTIVLKALQKKPDERYATVAAMMDDLQLYAAGRPVKAQRESVWYRTRKFIVRNRFAVSGAVATALLLLTALLVSLWQAAVARDQAVVAQREAQRAQAVQGFLLNLFRVNTDAQADPLKARNLTARDLLDLGAARVEDELRDSPQAQDAVLTTLADMYRAVGEDDSVANIDQQLVEVRRRLYGPQHPLVAAALLVQANALQSSAQRPQILQLLAEAKKIVDARADTPRKVRIHLLMGLSRVNMYTDVTKMRDYALQAVEVMRQPGAEQDELSPALRLAGRANYWLGDWQQARVLLEQALHEARRDELGNVDIVVTVLLELADVLMRVADVEGSERLLREALALSQQRNGENHVDTVHIETRLASFLHATGRRDEARQWFASALRKSTTIPGNPANLLIQVQRNQAISLYNEGQFEASAKWNANDVTLQRRLYPNSINLASALYSAGQLEMAFGRYSAAMNVLTEGSDALRMGLGGGAEPVTRNRFALLQAQLAIAQGQAQAALDWLQQVAPSKQPEAFELPVDDIQASIVRSAALLQLKRNNEARSAAQHALEPLQQSPLRRYFSLLEAEALLQLGRAQVRSGESVAARVALVQALALRSAADHPSSPWIAEAQIGLAECLFALGKQQDAQRLLRQATAIFARHKELGAHFTQPLIELQRHNKSR